MAGNADGSRGMTLPYVVAANEFLNFKGEKFSKSKGTGFSMLQMLENTTLNS